MSISTDAMYDASSRYIHQMFRVHFSSSNILEVTKSNYLISSSILEETYKHSDSPFGDVTSNEIDIVLYNDNGMFNPANTSGQYYGLIKKGVKIEAFIRPDEATEWDQIGVYYVNDWTTSTSGATATITANDVLYSVLNGPVPPFPVYRNIAFKQFVDVYFGTFGLTVIVDDTIDYTIPYAYTSAYSSNKSFLLDLMKSALADCFCSHDGNIRIISKVKARNIRATLTDSDQIINVSVKQSIVTNYDSSTVTCYNGQESAEQSLIDLASMTVTPGLNSTGKLTTSAYPVLSVRSVKVSGIEKVSIRTFSASALNFEGTLQSTADALVSISVVGTVLDNTEVTLGNALETPLSVDSLFVQDENRARSILRYTEAFVKTNTPVVELAVRGNPKIELGDKIEIDSAKYRIKYTGIVIKASYEYAGSLSGKLTLLDASTLEEV